MITKKVMLRVRIKFISQMNNAKSIKQKTLKNINDRLVICKFDFLTSNFGLTGPEFLSPKSKTIQTVFPCTFSGLLLLSSISSSCFSRTVSSLGDFLNF